MQWQEGKGRTPGHESTAGGNRCCQIFINKINRLSGDLRQEIIFCIDAKILGKNSR
jgi:hypothetical protein